MKRFGSFKPLDSVVSQDKLANLHVAVSSIAELTEEYPNNTIAVFTRADGDYSQGDVAIRRNGTWIKLTTSFASVGPVTNLRGFRLDKKVCLKYKSPADSADNNGSVTARWGKEIVVRKYGSSPTTEYDGTVVRVVVKKNLFNDNASQYLIDYIPDADGDSQWYYRVFVVADNGKIDYEHTTPGITIYDMPWSNVIEAVRNGQASKIFSVGDAFRLDDGNELVIANITKRSPYRITMLLRYPRYMMPFDGAKGGFRLTRDTRVVARKTYYVEDPSSPTGYRIEPLYSGTPITTDLYEAVKAGISSKGDGGREANGCNRWSLSDIRYWMNITSYASISSADRVFMRLHGGELTAEEFNDPSIIPDSKPIPPYLYLKRYQPDILKCLSVTTCKTAIPVVDGVNTEETQDRFFIPSYTEITGEKNNGKYSEGSQFELYASGLETGNCSRMIVDAEGTSFVNNAECFTRSPYLGDASNGFQLLQTYGGEARLMTAKDDGAILVAFNIG